MTPQINTTDDSLPDWHEPFPEPNTIPDGWDVSNLMMGVRAFSNAQRSASPADTATRSHQYENSPSYHHSHQETGIVP
jgi:hypothetical protein